VNHTLFPKEDHLPDCASSDNEVKKGDCVVCDLYFAVTQASR